MKNCPNNNHLKRKIGKLIMSIGKYIAIRELAIKFCDDWLPRLIKFIHTLI